MKAVVSARAVDALRATEMDDDQQS